MAYRDPQTLICPSCGLTGPLTWVVGEGPSTKPGEGPFYVQVLDAGDWSVATTKTAPEWQGSISCPTCGAIVRQRP